MARDKVEELWFEDDCCMNCGKYNFTESKVSGLCIECFRSPLNVEEERTQ